MISKFYLFKALLAGILFCSAARAQVRDGAPSVRGPSPHAGQHATRGPSNSVGSGVVTSQSSQQASVIHVSPGGRNTSGFAPGATPFNFDNTSGVPGLGFDFPHLAAISRGLGNNSSSHFGHNGHFGQGSFVPILFGGYPYPCYYDDLGADQPEPQQEQQPETQAQSQPQIIVIQQPVSSHQGADSESDAGNLSASASASAAAVPIPDVGNFILVRRDGRILFASLFSVVGKQLQYVTPEGIRHTLAMSDLDTEATQQMNEARGTTVQVHN